MSHFSTDPPAEITFCFVEDGCAPGRFSMEQHRYLIAHNIAEGLENRELSCALDEATPEVAAGLEQFEKTPILLLWGEKDFVFKPEVLSIFEKIWPHAEVHRFPEAGHYVLEDAGAEIVPIVRDFLARHPV